MSVVLETSKGDFVVDLFYEQCPLAAKNFLKLCKMKYYNNCLFHNVQRDFIAQTGDPTGTGKGGSSVYGVMYGEQARFFDSEIRQDLKHTKKGMVGMVAAGENLNASQFYITLGAPLDSLDEKYAIFGEVAEGHEVLEELNDAMVDDKGRPYQNIRIRHTIVLEDPFDDPPELEEHVPEGSPPPVFAEETDRLEDDWVPGQGQEGRDQAELEKESRENEAKNRAVVLEMIGDLPEADVKPPSNMLFLCKLNPVTTEEDLEIIFSRFGDVTSCDIIRDWKTGDSLCYAFIGFGSDAECEEAYFKMNNVLIDDRRVKVDFSQSVHHLWRQFRKFGRKGHKDAGHAADQHMRSERQGGPTGDGGGGGGPPKQRDRFTLKEGIAGGIYAAPRGGGGRGGSYGLMLEGEEEEGVGRGREGGSRGAGGSGRQQQQQPRHWQPPRAGAREERQRGGVGRGGEGRRREVVEQEEREQGGSHGGGSKDRRRDGGGSSRRAEEEEDRGADRKKGKKEKEKDKTHKDRRRQGDDQERGEGERKRDRSKSRSRDRHHDRRGEKHHRR